MDYYNLYSNLPADAERFAKEKPLEANAPNDEISPSLNSIEKQSYIGKWTKDVVSHSNFLFN
jgi:hypothetical protein